MEIKSWRFATLVWVAVSVSLTSARGDDELALPNRLTCVADQTAGFHDYPHNEESYESVVFFESSFKLRINRILTSNRPPDAVEDLFLTFTDDEGDVAELSCVQIRAVTGSRGYSCHNTPPSELLLINSDTLRFTRTSIGGWAFAGAEADTAGDSIFVEYGTCTK